VIRVGAALVGESQRAQTLREVSRQRFGAIQVGVFLAPLVNRLAASVHDVNLRGGLAQLTQKSFG
jgi:hypothetical protein